MELQQQQQLGGPELQQDFQLPEPSQLQEAMQAGYTHEEIRNHLIQTGAPEDMVDSLMLNSVTPQVTEAKSRGMTNTEIASRLTDEGVISSEQVMYGESSEYEPTLLDNPKEAMALEVTQKKTEVNDKMAAFLKDMPDFSMQVPKNNDNVESQAAKLRNLNFKYGSLATSMSAMWSPKARAEAIKTKEALDVSVVEGLKANGVNAFKVTEEMINKDPKRFSGIEPNEIIYIDKDGSDRILQDSNFFEDLLAAKMETFSSLAGGAGLGAATAAVCTGGLVVPVVGQVSCATGIVASALFGAGTLGGAGRVVDLFRNAEETRQTLTNAEVVTQLADSTAGNLVLDAVGASTGVAISKLSGKGVKALSKTVGKLLNGKDAAARREALEGLRVVYDSDDAIKQAMAEWAIFTGEQLDFEVSKDVVKLFALTTEEGAKEVSRAMAGSKTSGRALRKMLLDHADEMVTEAGKISEGRRSNLPDMLNLHQAYIKKQWKTLETAGFKAIKGTDYALDMKAIDILPTVDKLIAETKNFSGPRKALIQHMQEFRDIAGIKEAKKLTTGAGKDAIELVDASGNPLLSNATFDVTKPEEEFKKLLKIRSAFRDFRNEGMAADLLAKNGDLLNSVQKKLDAEITRASGFMKTADGKPTGWKKAWDTQMKDHANFKVLEKKAMYKAMVSGEPSVVMQALRKDITNPVKANPVLRRLPANIRSKFDAEILNTLIDDAVVKNGTASGVFNIEKINKRVADFAFINPEAKKMKFVISEFSNLIKTYPELKRASLTAVGEATKYGEGKGGFSRFGIIQETFKFVKGFIPGLKEARIKALTNTISEIIDNPIGARSLNRLKELTPENPELYASVKKYVAEYAQYSTPEATAKAPIYTNAKITNMKARDTSFGRGILADVKERKKSYEKRIPTESIASPANVAEVVAKLKGRELRMEDYQDPEIQLALAEDFAGVAVNDKVLIYKH